MAGKFTDSRPLLDKYPESIKTILAMNLVKLELDETGNNII
jgi:hypothetical protein